MKKIAVLIFLVATAASWAQKKEKVNLPDYVNYKYCKAKIHTKAVDFTLSELVKNGQTYGLVSEMFFIGPVLWNRYKEIDTIQSISGGKVQLYVDKYVLDGKLIQSADDGKIVWDQIRSEFDGVPMRIRKPTFDEIAYYWSVISYDIEEPLLIAEAGSKRFIFDINKEMKIIWMDQIPDSKYWFKDL